MREIYQEQLRSLNEELIEMAKNVRSSVERSTAALFSSDLFEAENIISGDEVIDKQREMIEDDALMVLATQAPVASDLRQVVAALRVIADLERMGDMSVGIAKVVRRRAPQTAVPDFVKPTFTKMATIADQMITMATQILDNHDLGQAERLEIQDDELDELHSSLFRQLLTSKTDIEIESAIDIALLGRYYERIGDHAVAIARRVVFLVTGNHPAVE